ncbi:MAG: DUF4369 domain-containing protein, partial [Bacteroidales bacterium]
MKRYPLIFIAAAIIAGCGSEHNVTIKGTFREGREGMVYLDKSEVDRSNVADSAEIKRGRFKFTAEIIGPEFYQVRFDNGEFIGLLT